MAVTFRSRKVLDEPTQRPKEKAKKQCEVLKDGKSEKTKDKRPNSGEDAAIDNIQVKSVEVKSYVPPIPFLQRLKRRANEGRDQKFL